MQGDHTSNKLKLLEIIQPRCLCLHQELMPATQRGNVELRLVVYPFYCQWVELQLHLFKLLHNRFVLLEETIHILLARSIEDLIAKAPEVL